MIKILYALLFIIIFSMVQGIVYLIKGTTPAKEAKKKLSKVKNSSFVTRFVAEKQIELKKLGAGVLLKDQMTVSQWYMFKALMATAFGMIVFFIVSGVMNSPVGKPLTVIAAVVGWFFLDLLLRLQNKSSNDEMMPDIM